MTVDYTAAILLVLYLLLFGCGIFQLRSHYSSRNKKLTLRNGIVVLLTSSSFIRIFFWAKVCSPSVFDDKFMMLLFFLPVWCTFAGLSLLVVFYADALAGGRSKAPLRVCFCSNIVLLVLNVSIALVLDDPTLSPQQEANFSLLYTVYGTFIDFGLASMLLYYGHRFNQSSKQPALLATRIIPNSVLIFQGTNWVIIVAFVLRGIFSALLSSNGIIPLEDGGVTYNGPHEPTPVPVLFFFLIGELMPSCCVLLMLWKVGSKSRRRSQIHQNETTSGIGGANFSNNQLDTRLLSVEDAKVKIFLASSDKHASTTEDDEDEDEGEDSYLVFEDTHAHTNANANVAARSATPDHSYYSPSFSVPIQTTQQQQQQQQQQQHDPWRNVSSPAPSHVHHQQQVAASSESMTSSVSSDTSSINQYFHPVLSPNMHPRASLTGRFSNEFLSESPVLGNAYEGGDERYSDTLGPRDILLAKEKRRKSAGAKL